MPGSDESRKAPDPASLGCFLVSLLDALVQQLFGFIQLPQTRLR